MQRYLLKPRMFKTAFRDTHWRSSLRMHAVQQQEIRKQKRTPNAHPRSLRTQTIRMSNMREMLLAESGSNHASHSAHRNQTIQVRRVR